MAFQTIWYFSDLPTEIIDILEKDITKFDETKDQSKLIGDNINLSQRNSKNAWIPSTHWSAGLVWHYVNKANRENFLYDISSIAGEALQYTFYEPGQFYDWHNDDGIQSLYKPQSYNNSNEELEIKDFLKTKIEHIRKLSVIVQLSNHNEYEGGNVEIIDESGKPYILPRIKGTICVFDSRSMHKVHPVTKGIRKSLVGWIEGPRWK